MSNSENGRNWLRNHPLWVAGSVVVFIIGLDKYGHYLLDEILVIGNVVIAGVAVDWDHRTIAPKPWFSILLFGLVILVVLLGIFLLRSILVSTRPTSQLESDLARLTERYDVATKTLRGMMGAASRIQQQLFPTAARPAKNLKSVESTYLIHRNFDVEVQHVYEVAASDRPLHFMEISDGVDDGDDGVEYLDDIKFKVKDGGGQPLAYILSRNDPRQKRVVVYFLPQVVPGEATPRRVVVTYCWPGMLKQLNNIGREPYEWILLSKENIPEVRFGFYLEPGTGRLLLCEAAGSLEGKQKLDGNTKHPTREWPGWEYRIQDAPSGTYRLTVHLKQP